MFFQILMLSVLLSLSCTKSVSKKQSSAPSQIEAEVDENGNVLANISSANGGIISLSSSSNQNLQDVSLIVPAGSLSIDSLLSVKEATDVVNTDTATALNIASALKAGPSVAVESDNSAAINGALILSLPYTPSLGLVEINYIVIGIYFENGKPKVETFLGSEITIKDKTIDVSIKKFGAYQVARVTEKVEKSTVDSETTYVDKSVANAAGGLVNSVYMITNLATLPTCGTDRKNHLYFVKDTNSFHVCNGQAWSIVSVKGDKGDTGVKGDKGDKGDAGDSGVMVLGTPLKKVSDSTAFGFRQGLAPNQWVRFDNGFYSPLVPVSSNYKVLREPLYYTSLDCSALPYISLIGPFDIARLTYTGAGVNPYTYAETRLSSILPGSVIDPDQSCYTLGMFMEIDNRRGHHSYLSDIVGAPGQSWAFIAMADSTQTGSVPFKVTANPPKFEPLTNDRVVDLSGDGKFDMVGFNNKVYFVGQDQSSLLGVELWVTDGTPGGTVMVNDLSTSTGSSDPRHLTVFNNSLYFSATDGGSISGRELYKVDNIGTMSLVWDIESGTGDSNPELLTVFGDKLCFLATTSSIGRELHCIDTSESQLSYDIDASSADSIVANELVEYNSKLYFSANDGTTGFELWSYDGTSPPSIVADINPSSADSNPYYFRIVNSKLVFFADDGTNFTEPHSYNGTTVGMIADICTPSCGTNPTEVQVTGNRLYFAAYDVTNGQELWQTDGSTAAIVSDIYTGSMSSYPERLTAMGDRLVFSATDDGSDYNVYITNNTGTSVTEIQELGGSTNSRIVGLDNENVVIYDETLDATFVSDGSTSNDLGIQHPGSSNGLKKISKWNNINFLFTDFMDGNNNVMTHALRIGDAPADYNVLPKDFIKSQELPGVYPIGFDDQLTTVP